MKQFFTRNTLAFFFLLSGYVTLSAQGTLIDFNTIPKSGTALVLTHMDDDVIWMLPWWKITEKFISGGMPPTPVYQTIVNQQQNYLDANGYNIDFKSNWLTPWGMITHGEYSDYYWEDLAEAQYLAADHLIAYWDNSDLQLVRTEVDRIKAKLEQYIASPDVSRVITHNNWGEYGHQQHRAINKAVRELAVKYRKDVWMLGCDNGDFEDIDVPDGITYTMGSFDDPTLFTSLRTIYENNWCWTWPDMIPSGDHKFIKVVDAGADKSNILRGETVDVSGPSQGEPGAYIFDGIDDFMTLVGNSTSSFTIAMRVRPAVIKSMDISKMTEYPFNATSDRNFYLNNNGTVSASIFDGSSKVATSTTSLTAGNWSHIVMTGNGSSLSIYVNGVLENTIPAGSAITSYTTPEFVMGQTGVTSSFFNGQINDVNLYDRALSATEIAALSGIVYTINATAGTGGVISPAGVVTVTVGSNSTFSITPGSSYLLADLKVDNVSVGAMSAYTFNNVNANHTIAATFVAKATHIITAAPGSSGIISPSGAVTVAEGTNQTFTITPNTGYQVSDVLVDNASVGALSAYTFSNVLTDHTISAEYSTIPTYTVTAGSGIGGSVTPSGAVVVNQGSNQTFSITPNSGYRISGVLVDGNPVGAVSTYTLSNIEANHTISASFIPVPTYTVAASAGSGGSISPAGNVSVTEGANRTFTITPNTGYYITNVLVDNASVGTGSGYTFSNVTSNHTISATFAQLTYNITSSYGTGGVISPWGTVSVIHGSSRTFSIIPNTGYIISGVRVDNVSIGAVASYTFSNVTSSHTISATFTPVLYTITASAGSGGSITPSGPVAAAYGTNSTYSITPNNGYYISDVRIDNASVGAVSSYTFNNVTSNHTISATFTLYTYTLTASAGAGGSISPSGTVTLSHGANQTYTITPVTGYHVSDLRVDNISMGALSTYTMSNVSSNHTITASFSQIAYTITGSSSTGGSINPPGIVNITHGSNQSYYVTADYGYEISAVRVDNVSVGAVSAYSFSNVTSNHTISATFALLNYTISASAGAGGSITPSGTITLSHGSNQTYTISPDAGFEISDIQVDGNSVASLPVYTFTGITGSHTIYATFSPVRYSLYPSAGEGGRISPQNEVRADYGSNSSFTIIPDEGYNIVDVTVDNLSMGPIDNYTFTGISNDHTISASFVLKTYSINGSSGANGSIYPSGTTPVNYGAGLTYSFTPAEGYKISDVKIDNVSVGAVTGYSFENVVADHTISASFDLITLFQITASAGAGGTITPIGLITIPEESSQTYLISPDIGYRILKVLVDNEDLGALSEYAFISVESNHSILAEFTTDTEVSVYPNPFVDEFNVKIETPLNGKFDLLVFDVASRIVFRKTGVDGNSETNVNLQYSSKGVYIVRVYQGDKVVSTTKVVKQ